MDTKISRFYQSFSGTDTIAFLMFPGCAPIVIGSLTTISYSMFRNKKPVINIGRTNINGVTRGSRIFAGTMIFTLINQHWLRELQEEFKNPDMSIGGDYLSIVPELKVDELPPFDIMIVSANEYGSAVAMYIYGIDFTDEAQTISVEDLFTENTFSFIARDVSVFRDIINRTLGESSPNYTYTAIKYDAQMRTYWFDGDEMDWEVASEKAYQRNENLVLIESIKTRDYIAKLYNRDLYWSNSIKNPFVGADVIFVQTELKRRNFYSGDIDGIYSSDVADAVRNYQSAIGLDINGVADKRLFLALNSHADSERRLAIGINKNGTNIYERPYLNSTISGNLGYGETVEYSDIKIQEDNGVERLFLVTARGYIYVNDIYSYEFNNNAIDYPTLAFGANNSKNYVILLQHALQSIYNDFQSFTYGVYDEETVRFVQKFKNDYGGQYGLYTDGTVNPDTWIAIEDVSGGNFGEIVNPHYTVNSNKLPGTYDVSTNILNKIQDFYVTFTAEGKILTKVTVVAHYPSGHTKTVTNTVEAVNGTRISLDDYKEALYYDIKEGCMPDKADFFIYPYNSDPYKWTLTFGS